MLLMCTAFGASIIHAPLTPHHPQHNAFFPAFLWFWSLSCMFGLTRFSVARPKISLIMAPVVVVSFMFLFILLDSLNLDVHFFLFLVRSRKTKRPQKRIHRLDTLYVVIAKDRRSSKFFSQTATDLMSTFCSRICGIFIWIQNVTN